MRTRFDEQLEQLNNELIVMRDLCHEAINNAVKALIEGDENRLNKVFEIDTQIDRKEKDIESLSLEEISILREQVENEDKIIEELNKTLEESKEQ